MRLTLLICMMMLGVPGPLLRFPDTVAQQISVLLRSDPPPARHRVVPPRPGIAWHHPPPSPDKP